METIDLSELNLPEKEQKILESAIQVFSEKGFSAATTSEIAKIAGVAEGTIFRYFKTKKDILRSILIQTIKIMSSRFVLGNVEKIFHSSGDKDLRSVLKEFIYDRMKLVESIFPMARVVISEALYHEDVREALYQNIIVGALDIFRGFHSVMVQKGMMRSDVEPEVLLRSILGNIAVFIGQKMLFGEKFAFDDIEKEYDKLVDVLMYGIAVDQRDSDKGKV